MKHLFRGGMKYTIEVKRLFRKPITEKTEEFSDKLFFEIDENYVITKLKNSVLGMKEYYIDWLSLKENEIKILAREPIVMNVDCQYSFEQLKHKLFAEDFLEFCNQYLSLEVWNADLPPRESW
jgi:hypothetical protein